MDAWSENNLFYCKLAGWMPGEPLKDSERTGIGSTIEDAIKNAFTVSPVYLPPA
jgi:hypothetical protein